MTTPLQLDSYQYRCQSCHKLHAGPTLTFDFRCVAENRNEHGLERIYETNFSSVCDCAQSINITFKVREHPEGIFDYLGYESPDAEVMIAPKTREHLLIVDL